MGSYYSVHIIGCSFLGNNSSADTIKWNTSIIWGLEIIYGTIFFTRVFALVNQITRTFYHFSAIFFNERLDSSIFISSQPCNVFWVFFRYKKQNKASKNLQDITIWNHPIPSLNPSLPSQFFQEEIQKRPLLSACPLLENKRHVAMEVHEWGGVIRDQRALESVEYSLRTQNSWNFATEWQNSTSLLGGDSLENDAQKTEPLLILTNWQNFSCIS